MRAWETTRLETKVAWYTEDGNHGMRSDAYTVTRLGYLWPAILEEWMEHLGSEDAGAMYLCILLLFVQARLCPPVCWRNDFSYWIRDGVGVETIGKLLFYASHGAQLADCRPKRRETAGRISRTTFACAFGEKLDVASA